MSEANEKETAVGTVEEVLPDQLFRVRVESEAPATEDTESSEEETSSEESAVPDEPEGELILAYLAGKMRMNRIRVLMGDKVEMVLDPYGGRARIVRRLT
jgi:translation initiation factor IF-1